MPAYPKSGNSVYALPRLLAEDPPGSGITYRVPRGYVKDPSGSGSLYQFFADQIFLVIGSGEILAFDLSGSRLPARDLAVDFTGLDSIAAGPDRIYVPQETAGREWIRVFSNAGARLSSEDENLGVLTTQAIVGSAATRTHLFLLISTAGANDVRAFNLSDFSADGNGHFSSGLAQKRGAAADDNRIYVVSNVSGLRAFTHAGVRVATEDFLLRINGNPFSTVGLATARDRLYFLDDSDPTKRVRAFTKAGTHVPGEDFELPAGTGLGMTLTNPYG